MKISFKSQPDNLEKHKDLVSILSSLKEAYQQSGLNKDVECIDNQIKKLDVRA